MLILTRKISESFYIGDDVEIIVLNMGRGQVKIGIKAPKDIAVHRDEVYQRIQTAKQGASNDNQI